MIATKIVPSAAILITGLSGSGKTTLGCALVRRLTDYGIQNATLIDGEELRARLPRAYGHSLKDREAVWQEIVKVTRRELEAGRVAVICTIAHRASMRSRARKQLRPFFEVYLDCPPSVCAARDSKGHYQRALAAEYECFIGVTHPYEPSISVELRINTAALGPAEAEALLAEQVIGFLSRPEAKAGKLSRKRRVLRQLQEYVTNSAPVERPLLLRFLQRRAEGSKPLVCMPRASCAQLMIMYGGLDAFLGTEGMIETMSPLEFLRVSGLFGRNIVWIRDPYVENLSAALALKSRM